MTTYAPVPRPAVQPDDGRGRSLFAPTTVAGLGLPSAIAMAPMTRFRSPGGVPTAQNADYYRRRAAGGVGLIITEGVLIDHPSAGHEPDVPRMTVAAAAGWRTVVDEVHAEGAAIFAQLWHVGSERAAVDGQPSWTPSGIDEHGVTVGHAMTTSDIDGIITAFADAAGLARQIGFDGVEIHGAHGYLIDEFLWSATNRRTDGYAGSTRRRARFAAEIVAAVRAATAPDFPIDVRFSQFKERDHAARLAHTPDELADLLEPIAAAGATMLHASTRRWWEPAFAGSALGLAGWARLITGLPTIMVGSVGLTRAQLTDHAPRSLDALQDRYAAGEVDLVAVGRPLLANPDWVHLVAQGRHREVIDYRKEHERLYP